jgi:hypothetical protein
VAGELRLIPDPIAFKSRLRELQPDATNPPVVGVKIEPFPGPSDHKGFVVCLIPESGHKPHRAEWAGKQWYYRAGTSFEQAEPGLLRTLFYPQRSTQFAVEVTFKCEFYDHTGPGLGMRTDLYCSACLIVSGTASGRDVYVTLNHSLPTLNFKGRTVDPDWDYVGCTRIGHGFVARRPLHPGEQCLIFNAEIDREQPFIPEKIGDRYHLDLSQEPFKFAVHATDQERQQFEVDLSGICFEGDTVANRVQTITRTGRLNKSNEVRPS